MSKYWRRKAAIGTISHRHTLNISVNFDNDARSFWSAFMSDAFIICLNIERFRELLHSCEDVSRREILLRLLEEEQQKLGRLNPLGDDPGFGFNASDSNAGE